MEKRVNKDKLHNFYHFRMSLDSIGSEQAYRKAKEEFEEAYPEYEDMNWWAISTLIMWFKPTEEELIDALEAMGWEIYD